MQQTSRRILTPVFIALLLTCGSANANTKHVDSLTSSNLISVAKRILQLAGDIGMATAGTRVMGPAWPQFRQIMTPMTSELTKRDPEFELLTDSPGPRARAAANRAIGSISNDEALQNLLIEAFSSMQAGQEEILHELGNIEKTLFRLEDSFSDFERQSQARLTEILANLQSLRTESASKTEKQTLDTLNGHIVLGKHQIRFFAEVDLTNLQGHDPHWANTSDSIVYASPSFDVADAHDLMLSTDYGRSAERLTTNKGGIFFPRFSHNDRYIAFVSTDAYLKIFDRANQTTSIIAERLKVTQWSANHFNWSPQRTRIAYAVNESRNDTKVTSVYVYDVEIDQRRKLFEVDTDFVNIYPAWSPDGTKLGLSVGIGGEHDLWIYDYFKNSIIKVDALTIQKDFLWISDTSIAFIFGGAGTYRLAKYDIVRKKLYYLTRYKYFGYPSISEDRKTLAYAALPEMEEDVTEYQLLDLGSINSKVVFSLKSRRLLNVFPSLNSTGRKLVFAYDQDIFILQVGN